MVEEKVLLAQGISRLLWERDNAWLHGSSPGGCRKPGMPLPNEKTCGDWTFRQKPSTRRAGEAQYLGGMPWVSRATAMQPDRRHVVQPGVSYSAMSAFGGKADIERNDDDQRILRSRP